jgi:hypothetical protein
VQSSGQPIFSRGLIGVIAVIVSVGCDRHVDALSESPATSREDARSGQVDLDVAAIVAGMNRAHRAETVVQLGN